MSRYRNKQHNALRVMTATDRRRQAADEFRQRTIDRALRRALRHTLDEEFKLERPAP